MITINSSSTSKSLFNIYNDVYIRNNLNILKTVTIIGNVNTQSIEGSKSYDIKNTCLIYKNLTINKDLLWTQHEYYSIMHMDNMIVNNLNSDYICEINTVKSNNIYFNTHDNIIDYQKKIDINNSIQSKNISCNNSIIYSHLFPKDIIVNKNSTCFNINTHNLYIKKNGNINKNITIRNNLNIANTQYINNNCNILHNINIHKLQFINNINNHSLILPNNIYNYNINGSLQYNTKQNTVEGFYNSKWRCISDLYDENYTSYIKFKENNIHFFQNNNLAIECNHITNNLNIYKSTNFIYLNVNKSSTFNNLIFKENLTISNNSSNLGVLQLPYNVSSSGEPGQFRYNYKTKLIQYYSTKWNNLGIDGIFINNHTLHIRPNNIDFTINANICQFYNNLNVLSNLNIDNVITNNINIEKYILFNNPSFIKNNINSLEAYTSSNYNNNNFKLKHIASSIENNNFYNQYYSHYIYTIGNYNNYSDCLYKYHIDNNLLVNLHSEYIYHLFTNTDVNIDTFEITYFINNTNINGTLYINDLTKIKDYIDIIFYSDDNTVIYDQSLTTKFIKLTKNTFYKIKCKLKNIPNNTDKHDVFLMIRLKGLFNTNEIYFNNNDIDFLFNINNNFLSNITFSNNLNCYKIATFHNNVNIDTLNSIENVYINSNDNTTNKTDKTDKNNIITIFDNTYNKCFYINNYNINIGNTSKLKSNIIPKSNILIYNNFNSDTLYIEGISKIEKDVHIKNNLNIKNNCIINNINKVTYKNLSTLYLKINSNISCNVNINSNNVNVNNIFINYNKDNDIYKNFIINNIKLNQNIYSLQHLSNNNNFAIQNKQMSFNKRVLLNYDGNINIGSNESFNTFTVGNKIKPNLSISYNGDTNIYCNVEGFYLHNINIIKEVNILKSNII